MSQHDVHPETVAAVLAMAARYLGLEAERP